MERRPTTPAGTAPGSGPESGRGIGTGGAPIASPRVAPSGAPAGTPELAPPTPGHEPATRLPPAEWRTRLRVRYDECDPMNVAHHASYAPWLEIGRTELLRQGGMSYARMEREGVLMVVVRLEIRYRRPVRYDDVLEIVTRVAGVGRVKIDHEYEVLVVERDAGPITPELCATGRTTLACVDRDGRVRELPGWMA